ncbi:hypothetical protein SAMN04487928_1454 [Butyrivibrio proteoclasticus]|uniref:Uncharacterized protein n=1 Tax=Butyrivibrio proteoclasticus TaxID=43305 RepID=A0A1I5YFH1_9FIRM|nr:hypothetical protein SAMN04487928_1454 [Butyrivibrio proteoclasticus]
MSKVALTDQELGMVAGGVDWTKIAIKVVEKVLKERTHK